MTNILRPQSLSGIIGQKRLCDSLKITLNASKIENRAVPHILLSGRPGTGKTSIALAMAYDAGRKIQTANAASIKSIKDILPYLMRLEELSILFVDEIHGLPQLVEEFLYPAIEDFKVDLVTKGEALTLPLPRFTLIGATTAAGELSKPLRDRFQINETLDLYTSIDISKIAINNMLKLGIIMEARCIDYISEISRGTPRICNNLLLWIKDCSLSEGIKYMTLDFVKSCVKMKGIDEKGLTIEDRQYLDCLKNNKKAVGVSTIAATTGLSKSTIENVIEPYLLERQLMQRTSKGRVIV